VSEKKFKKYRFQLLNFILYHKFIPTSAVVFITISSAWKLKFFWRLLFWALYVCTFFWDFVLRSWSWSWRCRSWPWSWDYWSWSWSWNSGLDYKTGSFRSIPTLLKIGRQFTH